MKTSRRKQKSFFSAIKIKLINARPYLDTPVGKIVVFGLLVIMVALFLFWRFPNNIIHANFYGEDGSVYLQNIIDKGWLKAFLTPFNGYAIFGLYILEAIGWVVNAILFGGSLLTLPAVFAAVSIGFLASVICLPYLLFSRPLGKKKMGLVVLLGALMPLPLSPHIVLGTIGNTKWAFMYLAFLLVIYRTINHERLSRKVVATIDVLLFICAYTNSAVYTLIPILLVPYAKDYWAGRKKLHPVAYLKTQFKNFEFINLLVLGLLLVPQVIYVGLHGIPKLSGYLDTPYRFNKTIEIFINRTYLFGFTHYINGHLNNLLVILLFMPLLYFGYKRLKGNERLIFFSGIYAAGMATLLFVFNRPGVSDFFFGYKPSGSGPDQFFYAQTLIMFMPLVLLITTLRFNKWSKAILVVICCFVIASGLMSNARYGAQWRNASVFENDAGIFTDQALNSCSSKAGDRTRVTVYPYASGQFSLTAPTPKVCNDRLANYEPSVIDLGLRPLNNNYLALKESAKFYQTLKASEGNLDGIRIFLSNFGKNERQGNYIFELKDADCKQVVRTAGIPNEILDNSYYNVRFMPIKESKHVVYCFTIRPTTTSFDPLAIQRSQPNAYRDGEMIENNKQLQEDVVFMPLFSATK